MLVVPTSILPGDLPAKIAAGAAAGFDGIDLSFADLAAFDGTLEEVAALIAGAGLTLVSLGPVSQPLSRAKIAAKIDMARALGAQMLIVDLDAADPDILPDPATLGTVRLALRPDRAAEAAVRDMLDQHDHPAIGLALDSLAALGDGARPARLRDLDGARLFHLRLVDGPQTPLLPGQGVLNLAGLARVLARAGFRGPYCVGVRAEGPGTARNAYRALVTLLSDAARTEPALRGLTPDLPAKVPATGIEFIEFAVDETSAAELEAVLASLAFRRERRHLSKAVTLWRQGAINIVVNTDSQGHARQAFDTHGPCICDMGLRVADARDTVARARALGSDDFTQSVGLGELDIPAIRGVGGSVIHFIDENSDLHRVWDIEFDPVRRTRTTPPAGLRRIDHIAQTMRYDEMQSWLLYYLSTFEMAKSPLVDVADPSGIVRSQALSSPEGEVRLNLNGAGDAATMAGAFVSGRPGAGVQHLAFLSDDIFETSDILAHNGFRRLAIPRNYYADIQAEFGLDSDLVARMQAACILYDRDEAGAYFQLYGTAIFDGFFLEIVERQGRYAGFGARNAPIRLAAQAAGRDAGPAHADLAS